MSCPPHQMNEDGTACAKCGDSVKEMREAQTARIRQAASDRLAEAQARAKPRSDAAKKGWVKRRKN